jgi:hypothetical protein
MKSSPSKTRPAQEMQPSFEKLNAISNWIAKMLDRFPAKGRITDSEMQDWYKDLGPFSLQAIDFAFEQMRLGLYFPNNGQVIDLCISYEPSETPTVKSTSTCDDLCKRRHGKGYNENDMKWLFKRMQQIYAGGDTPDSEALLTELDEKRQGGAPEWRKVTNDVGPRRVRKAGTGVAGKPEITCA